MSGPVPAELGNLTCLRKLILNTNELSGTLPSSLTNLSRLNEFFFHENDGLCAPADEEFQKWLKGVPDVSGPTCSSP